MPMQTFMESFSTSPCKASLGSPFFLFPLVSTSNVADRWPATRGWSADFIPIMMLTHRMPGIIAHWSDAMSKCLTYVSFVCSSNNLV